MRPSRSAALLAVALVVSSLTACSDSSNEPQSPQPTAVATGTTADAASPTPSPTPTPTPKPTPTLPTGGRQIFPQHRLCGYVGFPGAPGQGRLGIGDLNERVVESKQVCAAYAGDRTILPVVELIATTVHGVPGPDGLYRTRTDTKIIDEWLAVARANDAILLLNIQPGQSPFIDEVRAFEYYLTLPDVGVALDPEWATKPGQIPGVDYGQTTGAELDQVSAYLAGLVQTHNLPQKVMLYHVLSTNILRDEAGLQQRPEVAPIKSIDGIGAPGAKIDTYRQVTAITPPYVTPGFKLFYEEDVQSSGVLMTPEEVLAIDPNLGYVLYE